MPKSFRGCRASSALIGFSLPSTKAFASFWMAASPAFTLLWLCGTTNLSVAFAFPRILPAACASRPRLAVGSALRCSAPAVSLASVAISVHARSAPSSLPSRNPCHFSGSRVVPLVTSWVVLSSHSLSFVASGESPLMSNSLSAPSRSSMVLSMFILWFENASKRCRVFRSGNMLVRERTATMVSSTRPRSLRRASHAPPLGSFPSRLGRAMPSILGSCRIMCSCTSWTSM